MKVLIVDPVHSQLINGLTSHGHDVVYVPDCNESEARIHIKSTEILVLRSKFIIQEDWIKSAPLLKVIARAGAGIDNINLSSNHALKIIHAGGANALAVAEHTLGILLSLTNKIHSSFLETQAGLWNRENNTGNQLYGKTAAVIGFGNTGYAVSKILSNVGVNVLAYDKYKSGFSSSGIVESTMVDIFEKADIISFHIPLTHETQMLVNDSYLQNFKKHIILLNMSRGDIVSTDTVLKYVKNGKIIAAGLDVISGEPFSVNHSHYNEIIQYHNILITPHIAGWTHESYKQISVVLLERLLAAISQIS